MQRRNPGPVHGLVRNVAEAVDPPRVPEEITPLSPKQARAFLETARDDRLEVLYVLAVHTGMRQGELFNLRWNDVDLDARVLRVRGPRPPEAAAPSRSPRRPHKPSEATWSASYVK
jgi:integrase